MVSILCTFHENCKNHFKYQKYLRGLIALLLSALLFFLFRMEQNLINLLKYFMGSCTKYLLVIYFFLMKQVQ